MSEWSGVLLLFLPLLMGMRDPFLAPEDHCASAQISLWHYRGTVSRGEQQTAIVMDASGKWRRLVQGQRLENGWTVKAVQPEQMDMTAGTGCEPSQWRWLREGRSHDSKDASGAAGADPRRHGKGKTGVADGG